MAVNIDDMTGVERPRTRRLLVVCAVLAPVVVLAGAAAMFVRAYVMPPTISVEEPPTSIAAQPAAPEPPIEQSRQPSMTPETTGVAPAVQTASWPPAAAPVSRNATSSVWDAVPLPGPPRTVRSLAPTENEIAVGPPISEPVPLPRPRASAAHADARVPLPRPRPTQASN